MMGGNLRSPCSRMPSFLVGAPTCAALRLCSAWHSRLSASALSQKSCVACLCSGEPPFIDLALICMPSVRSSSPVASHNYQLPAYAIEQGGGRQSPPLLMHREVGTPSPVRMTLHAMCCARHVSSFGCLPNLFKWI